MTMSAREFGLWRDKAEKGDKLVYFTGHLAHARADDHAADPFNERVRALGGEAWKASMKGLVALVQKRVGPMTFDYIAQRL